MLAPQVLDLKNRIVCVAAHLNLKPSITDSIHNLTYAGIAASNIEVEDTDIFASTIHSAFDLDNNLTTKLDLSSMENKKVKKLHETDLLMLDEVSMLASQRTNDKGLVSISTASSQIIV